MLVLTGPLFGIHLALAPAAFGPTRPMWGQRTRCTSSIGAFAGATFGGEIFTGAVEAAKRAAKFLHHGVKRHLERGAPPYQDVVVTSAQRCLRGKPDELAQAAPHPVALYGIADLLADGETNPRWAGFLSRSGLQDKSAGVNARAGPGHGPKVTPAF